MTTGHWQNGLVQWDLACTARAEGNAMRSTEFGALGSRWPFRILLALASTQALGCGAVGEGEGEEVGQWQSALSICSETVPANHIIDGIPAYSQCSASNGAVYSSNGVDTSSTSGGEGWVRTQYSGGYQCTELAHRYLVFKWNVTWIPNGDAESWCDATPPADRGLVQTQRATKDRIQG